MRLPFFNPSAVGESPALIYRSQNTDYSNSLALVVSTTVALTPWWEINCALTLQHQRVRSSHLEYNPVLNQSGLNANVVNQIRLPKDFSFEVSGMYQSATLVGAITYHGFGQVNAGVQKSFRNNGTLRLAIDDIFKTNIWVLEAGSFGK